MENKKEIKGNININLDTTPILFTDMIIWNISKDEIVLNFASKIFGKQEQIKIVARVGTSKEFFKKFIKDIEKNIVMSEVQGQTGKTN